MEQYLEDGDKDAANEPSNETSGSGDQDDKLYTDRIFTRFPQASHEHVRIIVDARQRFRTRDASEPLGSTLGIEAVAREMLLDQDVRHTFVGLERSIVGDSTIPYPSMTGFALGSLTVKCDLCGKGFGIDGLVWQWR